VFCDTVSTTEDEKRTKWKIIILKYGFFFIWQCSHIRGQFSVLHTVPDGGGGQLPSLGYIAVVCSLNRRRTRFTCLLESSQQFFRPVTGSTIFNCLIIGIWIPRLTNLPKFLYDKRRNIRLSLGMHIPFMSLTLNSKGQDSEE
jgi:hypothetical protein